MNRSVYSNFGTCGCMKLDFEKAAARRYGKKPVLTKVGKFVAKNAPKLARTLQPVFQDARGSAARDISARYAAITKSEQSDQIDELLALAGAASMSASAVEVLRAKIEDAFRTGATDGLSTIADLKNVDIGEVLTPGITDQVDPEAVFYASNRGGQLIKDLAGTTDEDMRALLADAIDQGITPEDLASQIQDLGAFSDARAMTIARTELAFAYVQGNVEGWAASGQVEQKQWILGDLHDIADECDDCVDAGIVGIDEDFVDGIDFPPAHPNCICDVLPVLVDSSGDGTDNSGDSTDGEDQ